MVQKRLKEHHLHRQTHTHTHTTKRISQKSTSKREQDKVIMMQMYTRHRTGIGARDAPCGLPLDTQTNLMMPVKAARLCWARYWIVAARPDGHTRTQACVCTCRIRTSCWRHRHMREGVKVSRQTLMGQRGCGREMFIKTLEWRY